MSRHRWCAGLMFPLLDDLQAAAFVSPIAGSGNHGHWLVGHLVFYEGRYREMMQGIVNPCESPQDKFGGGSRPIANSVVELIATGSPAGWSQALKIQQNCGFFNFCEFSCQNWRLVEFDPVETQNDRVPRYKTFTAAEHPMLR